MLRPDRVALVHDRLEQNGGAERVLWALHEMFPQAPIFTAIWNRQAVPRFLECDVRTSWMQELPGILEAPRLYAALYPLAFHGLKLEDYDVVISTTSSFAQGVQTNGALHLCYFHSPANIVWRPEAYFHGRVARTAAIPLRTWLKAWDRRSARQPDIYVATGRPVAERIEAFYQRSAEIVQPPLEGKWFTRHRADEFFLFAGRLVPHKRADLAIRACANLGLPLVVAGTGRTEYDLMKGAHGDTRFVGYVSDDELRALYARARAVLVPSEEEFGLVSLEAQAAGTPVIAYDGGGARETVIEGLTGVRFAPQTTAGLAAGIRRFLDGQWDRDAIRANAARFSQARFERELMRLIDRHRKSNDTVLQPLGMGNGQS
jgi:glycosyltransferase involved in cell wall biosynthesis